MSNVQRFPIRFNEAYKVISSLLGMPPSASFVDVDDTSVLVKMGWGFRARFPRSAISRASDQNDGVLSLGVHGWAGRWLVNGSFSGLVALNLDPTQRANVAGVPVSLRQLRVSVDEPEKLLACLAG